MMRFPVLVVFLLSGATVVSSETVEREDRYPSLVSPDGIEFYDFSRHSGTYHRTYHLDLPEGLTWQQAYEACDGEQGPDRTLAGCVADYMYNECWLIPAEPEHPIEWFVINGTGAPPPPPEFQKCLE